MPNQVYLNIELRDDIDIALCMLSVSQNQYIRKYTDFHNAKGIIKLNINVLKK